MRESEKFRSELGAAESRAFGRASSGAAGGAEGRGGAAALEELRQFFFRSYLLGRLGQAGLLPGWAVLASSLLFGAGHAYQGAVGVVSGSILGLYFAWRWRSSRNIHEIAIGHGLFDAAVFAVLLYS